MANSAWIETTLNDLVEVKHGFAFKGEHFRDEPPGDVLLTPGNFAIGGGFKDEKLKYYVGPVPEEFVLDEGELLITMTDLSRRADTLGSPAFVPKAQGPRFLHNQRLGRVVVRPGAAVSKRFLFYVLRTREYRHEVVSTASGTTVKHTSPTRIQEFRFKLPPLVEQQRIAKILGTLDDKIELNRRMNRTLEKMAAALFKSWFIDFNPVHAKAEGRDPNLPADIADLFPDSFEDSGLGEIPEGWSVVTLEELASIQGGKQLPTEKCRPSGRYLVFGANGVMGYAEKPTHGGFVIAFGRVGAHCGSIHWTYRGAWINNNASSVVPKRWPEYVLQAMLHVDFDGMRTGSAQPFIPNSALAGLRVVRPSDAVLDAFCSAVKVLRLKQSTSTQESRTLAAVRDALLPKLLSGEIRIKNP